MAEVTDSHLAGRIRDVAVRIEPIVRSLEFELDNVLTIDGEEVTVDGEPITVGYRPGGYGDVGWVDSDWPTHSNRPETDPTTGDG